LQPLLVATRVFIYIFFIFKNYLSTLQLATNPRCKSSSTPISIDLTVCNPPVASVANVATLYKTKKPLTFLQAVSFWVITIFV